MGYFSLQIYLSRKLLFFVRPVLCGTIYVSLKHSAQYGYDILGSF